ncbi:MAG: hypothetical protein AAGA68_15950 [Pseudomonadota bacterium]
MLLTGQEVLAKTQKGYAEMREQSDGILPREARTLLILVNGRDTVSNYRAALNGSKAFESLGGVDQLIALLIDLDYLDLITADVAEGEESETDETTDAPLDEYSEHPNPPEEDIILSSSPVFGPSDQGQALAQPPLLDTQAPPRPDPPTPPRLFASELQRDQLSAPAPSPRTSPGSLEDERVDRLRTMLAELFERHPKIEDRWSWMFRLEECRTAGDLLELVDAFRTRVSRRMPREIAKLVAAVHASEDT